MNEITPQMIKDAKQAVEHNESSENYYCDGEITKTEAKKRQSILVNRVRDLERIYALQLHIAKYVSDKVKKG